MNGPGAHLIKTKVLVDRLLSSKFTCHKVFVAGHSSALRERAEPVRIGKRSRRAPQPVG
eukprot:SAG22_NODE_850_length_6855_cov_13.560391_2_plen_59_part_00